jgi:hypothetical protein
MGDWATQKARAAEYALKGKDPIQIIVLEATREENCDITERELMNIGKFTHCMRTC